MKYYDPIVYASNESDERPWAVYYYSKIQQVVIHEGIEGINAQNFYRFTGLKMISLPSTLERIVDDAFEGCGDFFVKYNGTREDWDKIDGHLTNYDRIIFNDYSGVTASGTHGDNLYWNFDATTFTLTIYGTGPMKSVEDYQYPWYEYIPVIENIVIKEGVTSIGNSAFYECDFKNVSIPNTVTTIETAAFMYCGNYETLTIPSSVTTIGNNAFEASKITSISLPEAVTAINAETFKNAENLKSVELGSNVSKIGKSAFEGAKALTEINLPDTLRDVSAYAFKNTGLVSVNIGNGVVRIGTEAFADNKALKEVVLGENLEKLGAGSFMNCVVLAKINLPLNVNDFDMTAFKGCKALKKIAVSNDNQNFKVAAGAIYSADGKTLVAVANNTLTELKIADGTEVIAANAFDLATGINKITFPTSLVNVKNGALDVTSWFKAQNGAVYAGPVLYKVTGNVAELKIADKTTSIADNAVNNKTVKAVTIPATVKFIGAYAFADSAIAEIVVPNSVTVIGNNAFQNAASLKKVTLSNALETMGKAIFKDCVSLTSIKIPATIKNIPVDSFLNCKSLVKVDLGSVETIGKYAFANCEKLMAIELSQTLTELDPMSFFGCKALTAVNVKEGNAKFKSVDGVVIAADEDNVFNTIAMYPAGKQGGYTIANDIKFVADRSFYDCDNLAEVTFPNGIERIGNEAFFDCDALLTITLPEGARNVGDYAFASCNELREFIVNSNLTEYSDNVFDGCYYFNKDLVTINVTESSAVFIIGVALIFVVIGVIWYFKYQKKQVKQEQEIKEKIAERELLEKAKKIKEEMANKE